MSTVIDLQAEREERTPHAQGRARCLSCKYEWQAVAPAGTIWMECPACTLFRGRFTYHHQREVKHWECNCGNDLFFVNEDYFYCPNCGARQKGF